MIFKFGFAIKTGHDELERERERIEIVVIVKIKYFCDYDKWNSQSMERRNRFLTDEYETNHMITKQNASFCRKSLVCLSVRPMGAYNRLNKCLAPFWTTFLYTNTSAFSHVEIIGGKWVKHLATITTNLIYAILHIMHAYVTLYGQMYAFQTHMIQLMESAMYSSHSLLI